MKLKSCFKIFIFTLFLSLSFSFIHPNLYHDKIALASDEKIYNYIIKNNQNNDYFSLTGLNSDDSEYLISNELSNFDEVINLIIEELKLDNKSILTTPISFYFDNFFLKPNQQILLNKGLFIFSGKVLKLDDKALFEVRTEDVNNFNFANLEISSNSLEIIKVLKSKTETNLIFDNCNFLMDSENSYAIKFDNTACNLTLKNLNKHSTEFFFNFVTNLNIFIDNNFQLSNLKITLPYNLNNHHFIDNTNSIINSSFSIYSENSNIYSLKRVDSTNDLIFSSLIKLNHIAQPTDNNYLFPNSFEYNAKTNLPIDLIKNNIQFDGWFGTCIIDEITYYFDTTLLNRVFEENVNDGNIKLIVKSIFKTRLNELTNNFNNLFSSSESNEYSDNFIKLFYLLNQTPTVSAKWNYEIILNSNGGTSIPNIITSIDTIPTIPSPEKTGHTFVGWYLSDEQPCNLENTKTNTILFAKWQKNTYQITFISNDDQNSTKTLSFEFDDNIEYPMFSKTGHSLAYWKTENGDLISLNAKMPAENISIYAVWQPLTFITYFNSNGGSQVLHTYSVFGKPTTQPTEIPVKTGHTFAGWIDEETNLSFDFSITPAKHRNAIALWTPNQHTATLMLSTPETKIISFGESLNYIPIRKGFKFLGWFYNATDKFETMPDNNITLYPHWQEKELITLSLNQQKINIDHFNSGYSIISNLTGFKIEYLIDNNWTTSKPTDVGVYDIKITRAEDDNYAEYESILANGYQITPKEFSLKITIFLLFSILFIEIAIIILIKWLKNKKKNAPLAYSILLPFGLFNKTEFFVTLIAFALVFIAFIWIIIELILLHKTMPTSLPENKYDNRNTIKKIEDSSNDINIEDKVDDLLYKNNFIKEKRSNKSIKINIDDNDFDSINIFSDKK